MTRTAARYSERYSARPTARYSDRPCPADIDSRPETIDRRPETVDRSPLAAAHVRFAHMLALDTPTALPAPTGELEFASQVQTARAGGAGSGRGGR